MRLSPLFSLMLSATSAFAQKPSTEPPVVAPDSTLTASPPATQIVPVAGAGERAKLQMQLAILKYTGAGTALPTIADFGLGNRTVAVGDVVARPIGVSDGSIDIFGTVNGSVLVIDGDIRLHPGAKVTGDVIAVRGRVVNQGAIVSGETRALNELSVNSGEKTPPPPHTTLWALKLTLAWFAVLVVIGVGVMIFAEANLDGVVMALERGIGRSFLVGILGQMAALPLLAVLLIALALTIIGVLLVPFAIVAYLIAVAGLVTLGFLAIARLSGIGAVRGASLTARGVNLRAMFIGLIGYLGIWVIAAAFTWQPMIGGALRIVALIITWVAATAGLGATLLSRAGTQRSKRSRSAASAGGDEYSWQTPTPVSGVAASRRR